MLDDSFVPKTSGSEPSAFSDLTAKRRYPIQAKLEVPARHPSTSRVKLEITACAKRPRSSAEQAKLKIRRCVLIYIHAFSIFDIAFLRNYEANGILDSQVDSQQWLDNLELKIDQNANVDVNKDNFASLERRYEELCAENLELFTDNQELSAEKRELKKELGRACAEVARMREVMRRLGQQLIDDSYSL